VCQLCMGTPVQYEQTVRVGEVPPSRMRFSNVSSNPVSPISTAPFTQGLS